MNSECTHVPFGFCKECVKVFCETERKAGIEEGFSHAMKQQGDTVKIDLVSAARHAALEEAANIAEEYYQHRDISMIIADRIRRLGEKQSGSSSYEDADSYDASGGDEKARGR